MHGAQIYPPERILQARSGPWINKAMFHSLFFLMKAAIGAVKEDIASRLNRVNLSLAEMRISTL